MQAIAELILVPKGSDGVDFARPSFIRIQKILSNQEGRLMVPQEIDDFQLEGESAVRDILEDFLGLDVPLLLSALST